MQCRGNELGGNGDIWINGIRLAVCADLRVQTEVFDKIAGLDSMGLELEHVAEFGGNFLFFWNDPEGDMLLLKLLLRSLLLLLLFLFLLLLLYFL